MSIIYDALKKVEKTNPGNSDSENTKDKKPPRSVYLICILMVFIGFFIAKLVFDTLTQQVKVKTKERASPISDITSVSVESKPSQEANASSLTQVQPSETPIVQPKMPPNLLLNGVFLDQQRSYALINNQIVKEGDVIEGAKVVRILVNEVDLEFEGESIKLRPK